MSEFLDGLNESIKNATDEEKAEAFEAFNILFGGAEPGGEVPQAVKDLEEVFKGGGTYEKTEPEDEKPFLFVNSVGGYNILHCYTNEEGEARVMTLNERRATPGIWTRQFPAVCEGCKDYDRIGERVWKPEYKDRGWRID